MRVMAILSLASKDKGGADLMTDMIRINSNNNIQTHKTKYFLLSFQELQDRVRNLIQIQEFDLGYAPDMNIADPYARNCEWCYPWTNDINPETNANHNMDALAFLKQLPTSYFPGVVFDPPFSGEKDKRKYDGQITNVYTTPGAIKEQMAEIQRVLMPGGYMLKFGYNTTRHRNFDLVFTWVVNHGGNHNDTLVTLWQKSYYELGDFE